MDPPRPLYLLDLIHKALRLLYCDILHGEFQGSHTSLVGIKDLKRRPNYLCNICQNKTLLHLQSWLQALATQGQFTLHPQMLDFPTRKRTQPHPGRTQDSLKQQATREGDAVWETGTRGHGGAWLPSGLSGRHRCDPGCLEQCPAWRAGPQCVSLSSAWP